MPDIALELQHVDYVSDKGVSVSAWRARAEVLFTTASGALASFSCIVDTGAPFSVLPFSLWQTYSVQWNSLGQQLSAKASSSPPSALKWQDVDCSLGVTQVHLAAPRTGTKTSHTLVVVAKFANHQSQQKHLEQIAVLGMNFLTDNHLQLHLDASGADLIGRLSIP